MLVSHTQPGGGCREASCPCEGGILRDRCFLLSDHRRRTLSLVHKVLWDHNQGTSQIPPLLLYIFSNRTLPSSLLQGQMRSTLSEMNTVVWAEDISPIIKSASDNSLCRVWLERVVTRADPETMDPSRYANHESNTPLGFLNFLRFQPPSRRGGRWKKVAHDCIIHVI